MKRLVPLLLLAGCFAPKFLDGKTPCAADSDCPSGLHCATDKTCWHTGRDPVNDLSMTLADDGGLGDMSMNGDLTAGMRHQGEACSPADTCDTGNCVDGYCCNSTCDNTCQACNVAGLLGICSNIANGATPVGSRVCNAQDKSTCGRDGTCDGTGNCRDWPGGTECAAGTCDQPTGNFTYPSTCNGAGSCVANGGDNCAPYKCQDATQCYAICSDSTQCSGSNNCVSQSCGKLPNGRTCAGGNGALCLNGNCVDGHCCDTSCASACQACDVSGSLGMCTTVAKGSPHGTRTCTNLGTAPCGGSCDGTTSDCSYPDGTTPCGTSCSSPTQLTNSFCDVHGSCAAGTAMTCASNFACAGSACLATCSNDGNCAGSSGCTPSHSCVPFCVCDDTKLDECISQ